MSEECQGSVSSDRVPSVKSDRFFYQDGFGRDQELRLVAGSLTPRFVVGIRLSDGELVQVHLEQIKRHASNP